MVRNLLTIKGVYNYAPVDLNHALEFLEANVDRFPFSDLVSPPFPLERTAEAFESARQASALRVAVNPRLADHSRLNTLHDSGK